MGIFRQFPYSNFHDMNMDELIKIMRQMQDEWAATKTEWDSYKDFIDNYFDTLDVSAEVLAALREMAADGELNTIMDPVIIEETVNWLNTHVTPTTPVVDKSLLISGAAADAKVTGDKIRALNDSNDFMDLHPVNVLYGERIDGYYISSEGNLGTNPEWSYYFPCRVESNRYYNSHVAGAIVAFYDENLTFLSGLTVQNVNTSFKTPATCKYIAYSFLTIRSNPYVELATGQELTYINNDYKTLSDYVSLSFLQMDKVVTHGKNLFNKWNVIEGKSFDYSGATAGDGLWINSSYCYCPDYIPAKGDTIYCTNNIAIISEYDADHVPLGTYNFTTGPYPKYFRTNANTKLIRVATTIERKNVLQVEEGSVNTAYEPFKFKLKYGESSLIIHTVKADGSGDYTTISDAVSNASDDDIIIVYPATYNETVKAYNKRVHIIGVNRASCILQHSGLNYANPPLEMAKGSVRNLTIHATNTGEAGDYPAYCVHIDNDNEANEALSFTNVDFINDVHQAVGIGLRAHFTLTFDTCRFRSVNQGALYCHDWETSNASADKTGQKLIVRNCSIVNNSDSRASIMLQSQELVDKGAEAVFIGNTVLNKAGGALISMNIWDGRTLTNNNFLNSSDWVLSEDSALNTLDTINYGSKITEYRPIGPLLGRVTNVTGGFVKIGQIVYINVKCTGNASHTSSPGILSGVPAPLTGTAALSAIVTGSGASDIQNALGAGINNTNIYIKELAPNEIYFISGSYIAAE